MANDNRLAQGLGAANQALRTGLGQIEQLKQQNQQRLQQKFNQVQQQRDSFLKLAGNENLPEGVRQKLLNMGNQFSTALGQPLLGSEGTFGQAEKDFSKAVSIGLQLVDQNKLSRKDFNAFIMAARQTAVDQSQTGDERQNIEQLFEGGQEQAFGTGTPQQFGAGVEQTLGRITPSGQVAPITQAGEQQPVTQPNEFVIQTLQAREKTFKDDKVFQEVRKQLIDSERLKALIEANVPGSIGPIVTQRAKASGEQRITDQDVVRFAGDPSAQATVKRFITKVRAGKLPKGDQQTFIAMQRVIEGIARERLKGTLDSATKATSQILPGVPEDQIRNFLSSSVDSDLKAAQFEASLDSPEKIKAAFRAGRIGKFEAKQLLTEKFKTRFK